MICGSKVLRGVLLLRVGFKDIAVGTDMTFLIAMYVAILVSSCLWGRARAWDDTILLVERRQLLLMLSYDLRVSRGIDWRSQCRGSGGHGVRVA